LQEKYTGILGPIHAQYLDLIGHMSAKHFDEAQFFSKRMLFVRTAETDVFKVRPTSSDSQFFLSN
jgi:hypothetical protein